jgi:hypothetical protein
MMLWSMSVSRHHSTGLCLEPWSSGSKEVSFLLSKPFANLICGAEQLPKLAPEALELPLVTVVRAVPLFGVVESELLAPPTGFPVLSIGVTALKLVVKPKTSLNAGEIFN